ncbi:MAG: TIGR00266 family protein [Spirochaetia bacterium]|nr:TIGR00266 family protein [Spirochaetia bacterium]
MKTEILHRHSNTAAKISLSEEETCTTESGAMIAMSGNMSISTSTYKKGGGGIFKAAKRLLAGESFFLNHFQPSGGSGELWVSPVLTGDLVEHNLSGEKLIVQSGSFLAAASTVNVDVGWQGFKNFLSGESLFWLNLSGDGPVILSAFGVIYTVEVDGEYIVDTGHIVAFDETLNFSISKAGKSWISSFFGGEGIICRFKGKGKIYCQSHNPSSFGHSLTPSLKPRRQ